MFQRDTLERNLPILLRGLEILDIPLLVTQQYTRGLGPTIPMIQDTLGWKRDSSPDVGKPYIEKIAFSCWGEPECRRALAAIERPQVLLAGIETHICVLQTSIDLKQAGYTPVVIEDCTSCQRENDKRVALQRLRAEGILLSTCESILFELMREAGTDTFRAVSKLVTERAD
jgi:isochorismate hydrolase